MWLRRRELVQREEQRRTSASSRFTSLVRQASSSTIKLLSAEHAAEHAAHATAQAITKAAHTVEHAAEHAAHAVAHAVLHPGEAVHELTHKADEAAAKIQALRRGQLERRLTRQSTLTASKKTRDEKLDAKAKVSRMLNGLQVIVFVAGFVAGIMACGAMLRFEEEFQVSNSVTGVCYMLAYALGCCCLLALMKLAHKFALLKPPFDMILSQSLLLVSFALCARRACAPATVPARPPRPVGPTPVIPVIPGPLPPYSHPPLSLPRKVHHRFFPTCRNRADGRPGLLHCQQRRRGPSASSVRSQGPGGQGAGAHPGHALCGHVRIVVPCHTVWH